MRCTRSHALASPPPPRCASSYKDSPWRQVRRTNVGAEPHQRRRAAVPATNGAGTLTRASPMPAPRPATVIVFCSPLLPYHPLCGCARRCPGGRGSQAGRRQEVYWIHLHDEQRCVFCAAVDFLQTPTLTGRVAWLTCTGLHCPLDVLKQAKAASLSRATRACPACLCRWTNVRRTLRPSRRCAFWILMALLRVLRYRSCPTLLLLPRPGAPAPPCCSRPPLPLANTSCLSPRR